MDEYIIQTDSYDCEDRIDHPAVLVYFYDHRDIRCRGFEAIIGEVAERYQEDVIVLSVDTEQSPELAYRYGIDSVPFVIFFRDGEPAADIEGANLPGVYCDMIDSYI